MSTLLLAAAHLPLAVYLGWPTLGERYYVGDGLFVAHQLLGVIGLLGVVGPLLALLRLVSLRDLGIILAAVHAAWAGVAWQHRSILAHLVNPAVPLGLNLGPLYGHVLRGAALVAALLAVASSRKWNETTRRSTLVNVLLLLITLAHAAASVLDTQHLVPAPFVIKGDVAQLTQALLGVVHFAGFFGGLLALIGLVNARTAAVAALVVQIGWVTLKLMARPQYEGLFDGAQLSFPTVLSIHAAQIVVAFLLLALAPRAAPPAAKGNKRN